MSSAWKHYIVVSRNGDFGYLLGINERGSGKLRFSCITITYVSEFFFIYCYLKGDGEFGFVNVLIEVYGTTI